MIALKFKNRLAQLALGLITLGIIGMLLPQRFEVPVAGATVRDYNQQSFWHHPWGRSGTHKGVDIFAKRGAEVRAATGGVVLFAGRIEMGGNVVLALGPKWRLHYYAHLDEIRTKAGWIDGGEALGTVGDSGNAKGKQPHLHYSMITMVPYPWRADSDPQGWRKMFFLNPIPLLNEALE